eukprot:jgi/Astpho2/1353/fgenesh1_pg.00024_%23_40_t
MAFNVIAALLWKAVTRLWRRSAPCADWLVLAHSCASVARPAPHLRVINSLWAMALLAPRSCYCSRPTSTACHCWLLAALAVLKLLQDANQLLIIDIVIIANLQAGCGSLVPSSGDSALLHSLLGRGLHRTRSSRLQALCSAQLPVIGGLPLLLRSLLCKDLDRPHGSDLHVALASDTPGSLQQKAQKVSS